MSTLLFCNPLAAFCSQSFLVARLAAKWPRRLQGKQSLPLDAFAWHPTFGGNNA